MPKIKFDLRRSPKFSDLWQKRLKARKENITPEKKVTKHKKQYNKNTNYIISQQENKIIIPEIPNYIKPIETEHGLISQVQSSGIVTEEINKIIKKMTLSFTAQKAESSFVIDDGIFHGTSFQLSYFNHNLDIEVKNSNKKANKILYENKDYLKLRLLDHEINLRNVVFNPGYEYHSYHNR